MIMIIILHVPGGIRLNGVVGDQEIRIATLSTATIAQFPRRNLMMMMMVLLVLLLLVVVVWVVSLQDETFFIGTEALIDLHLLLLLLLGDHYSTLIVAR